MVKRLNGDQVSKVPGRIGSGIKGYLSQVLVSREHHPGRSGSRGGGEQASPLSAIFIMPEGLLERNRTRLQ